MNYDAYCILVTHGYSKHSTFQVSSFLYCIICPLDFYRRTAAVIRTTIKLILGIILTHYTDFKVYNCGIVVLYIMSLSIAEEDGFTFEFGSSSCLPQDL